MLMSVRGGATHRLSIGVSMGGILLSRWLVRSCSPLRRLSDPFRRPLWIACRHPDCLGAAEAHSLDERGHRDDNSPTLSRVRRRGSIYAGSAISVVWNQQVGGSGPDRDRTGDLMNAIHARSQLRYWPTRA